MIQVHINVKGARAATVEKLIEETLRKHYQLKGHISVSATKITPPETRSQRFGEAQSAVSNAKSDAESLRDELQEWLDGIPENLQGSDKASQLEEAISSLEEFIDSCDTAENVDVDFPSMMG